MTTILIPSFQNGFRLSALPYRFQRFNFHKPIFNFYDTQIACIHQKSPSKERERQRKQRRPFALKKAFQPLEKTDTDRKANVAIESPPSIQRPINDVFMSTKPQKLPGLNDTLVFTLKTEQQVREGIQLLQAHMDHHSEKVVGFDTETRIKPGCDSNKVSVIQLATRELCLVINIRRIVEEGLVFPHSLQLFLQDANVMKVGVCAGRDAWALNDSYAIKCANVLDLKHMAIRLGHRDTTLKSLAIKYGDMKLNKQLQHKRWDKRELREKEVVYAAQDAVASYLVYLGLKKRGEAQDILQSDNSDLEKS